MVAASTVVVVMTTGGNCIGDVSATGSKEVMDWMCLGKEICKIFGTGSPYDFEVTLTNAVFHPMKTHVHCFGFTWLDLVVG
jgi:hypothetical protein